MSEPTQDQTKAPWSALRVALLYAAFGTAWIVTSDLLTRSDLADLSVDISKGLLFVALSALLIGFLIQAELKRRTGAERALRRRDAYLQALINGVTDIVAVVDRDLAIRFHTASTRDILGYEQGEVDGTNILAIVHPDDRDRAEKAIRDTLRGDERYPRTVALRCRHKDGSWHHLETNGTPLGSDDHGGAQIVITARDVTERIEAEQALRKSEAQLHHAQKMEAVGRLAGGVAHDFNNLITAILGYIHVLREAVPNRQDVHDDLDEIASAAERAQALTRQLLTFSRREVTQPRDSDICELLEGARRLLVRLLGSDIELDIGAKPDCGSVLIDPGRFEQVILNLAVNARDAMPRGGRLSIRAERIDDAADERFPLPPPFVRIDVEDNGVGMDAQTAELVFEPFFTTKEADAGTGLGMSIVYSIVTAAGGHIHVASQPDRGTLISFALPTDVERQPGAGPVTTPQVSLPRPEGDATILVVEDEPGVRRLCTRLLSRLGYTVLAAANGDEAFRMAEGDAAIDLLLTDVVMPGLDGGQLIEAVLEKRPTTRVLVMSGYTDDTVLRHGIEAGMYHFLAKPFTPSTLATAVTAVLASDDAIPSQ